MGKRRKLYEAYLNSAHWKNLRQVVFKRDNFQCLKCGSSKKLRGHHKKYRGDLWQCTERDIETLCEACHNEYHREKKRRRFKNRKPKNVNKQTSWSKLLTIPDYIIKKINWADY